MASSLKSAGISLEQMDYDQRRQVRSLTTRSETLSFAYDPDGYRIQKQQAGSSFSDHTYLEGEHVEARYREFNGFLLFPEARYLRGVVVDEIVNGYELETNLTFHHDHLNTVVRLSGHNGDVEQEVEYSPFGQVVSEVNGSTFNQLLYTGRERDPETGLYYYRARYYDPEVGRFLTEDPLKFAAGDVNFYAYVGNSPTNFSDPEGRFAHIVFGAAVGGVVGIAEQGVATLVTGEGSFSDFAGSFVSGVVTGGLIAGTGGASLIASLAAAGAGEASGEFITQSVDFLSGERTSLSGYDVILAGGVGVAAGRLGAALPINVAGITSGRNSYEAVAKSTTTKLRNKTIGSVSATTVGKAAGAAAVSDSTAIASEIALDALFENVLTFDMLMDTLDGEFSGRLSKRAPVSSSTQGSVTPASGGFVLYPGRVNTNGLQRIYAKPSARR